jgi:hypothetical protein
LAFLLTAACGASGGDGKQGTAPDDGASAGLPGDPGEKESAGSHYDYGATFAPAPPADGYTRFVAPVIPDIPPGADITYCQYVMAPADEDIDILDVTGVQSAGGHHTVAFSTSEDRVGESLPCDSGDMKLDQAGFLGGTGGDGAAIELPENTAFRLSKGTGIMLNNHFINTSEDVIEGQSVLDLKFAEVDPHRRVAGLLAITAATFQIPPSGRARTSLQCTFEKDIELFAVTNHMHEYGDSASSRIVRDGSTTPEVVSDIPRWSPEMTGNPRWNMYLGDETLKLAKGSTIDVECAWNNTSASSLTFPREMCLTVGMFFTDHAETRACADGAWISLAPQL